MTRIFRDLHSNPGKPLILPNVWDAGGARIVESVDAKAVATTSAGVAWSKGYPDGNKMQPRLLAHLAVEIVKTVKLPVSIDFEAGYSEKPAVVVENLKPIVAAGISGINVEDGTDERPFSPRRSRQSKRWFRRRGSTFSSMHEPTSICRISWLTTRRCGKLWIERRRIKRLALMVYSYPV
jgi:hypothetical protein